MQSRDTKRGFTLIELLVVVAIIGILSSVVLASLNSARVKARDVKRKAELRQITTALELYYDSYGLYPPYRPASSCGGSRPDWATSICTESNWLSTDINFLNFMPSLPKDPLNKINGQDDSPWWYANSYTYGVNADRSQYDLLTNLENISDPERCELRLWRSWSVWAGETGCWSTATPGSVPDRAKQIWATK
ncbi:MAG: prepilin-type N-terminal cleavage/methylation domain-containing protein [Candidatus Paceibacterota bacterium]